MWRKTFTTVGDGASSCALRGKHWDALIIGGGHNGLTAAAYLARGGLSVAVLERRHIIGGAAVTEELVPGFKFSRCSYVQSLLRPTVIKELELERHGLKMLKLSPSSFTPCLDGRYLMLGSDEELNRAEISKFSRRDADAYPRYEDQLKNFCKFMDPLFDSPPPETSQLKSSFSDRIRDKSHRSIFWAHCLWRALDLGQNEMVYGFSNSVGCWFQIYQTDVLKATLGTNAVVGTMGSVNTPGSGYVLLHHVIGETEGAQGIWSYVEGGMGAVSSSIGNAAREAGAQIVTNAEVSQLMLDESGRAKGVLLADGSEVHSSIVLSNATPYRTFMELVPEDVLPDEFLRSVKNADYTSGTTKINLAVDRLPSFQSCKLNYPHAGPQHMGSIFIGSESLEAIDSACQDAVNGVPSRRPFIEMTIPSVLDKTLAPPGKHVVGLFIQYTPYKPSDGSWMDPVYRKSFADRCFSLIDEYCPGFSSSVIGYDMLTPPDLEREIGLTGGNIFHGAMGLDSLFLMRPVKGWSSYRTPVQGLYLCGSGAHPGGGVMGAPGRNAAQVVLQDVKRSSS